MNQPLLDFAMFYWSWGCMLGGQLKTECVCMCVGVCSVKDGEKQQAQSGLSHLRCCRCKKHMHTNAFWQPIIPESLKWFASFPFLSQLYYTYTSASIFADVFVSVVLCLQSEWDSVVQRDWEREGGESCWQLLSCDFTHHFSLFDLHPHQSPESVSVWCCGSGQTH